MGENKEEAGSKILPGQGKLLRDLSPGKQVKWMYKIRRSLLGTRGAMNQAGRGVKE